MKKKTRNPTRFILTALLAVALSLGAADYCIDDSLSLRVEETLPASSLFSLSPQSRTIATMGGTATQYTAKLFGILPIKNVRVQTVEHIRLCPGGMPFGAKMFTEGLIVVGFSDVDCADGAKQPAYEAGVRTKDIILSLNDVPITSAEELSSLVAAGDGAPIELLIRRGDSTLRVQVTPALSVSENQYKTGMWVRDNTAGIGTITYVDPQSGAFGGLGHGICDAQSGALLPLSRGIIVDVTITGVQKGTPGVPGELKGYFSSGKRGTLLVNSGAGVFGILSDLPDAETADKALPIALQQEIRDGKAFLLCTLDDGGIHAYEIQIRKIKNALDYKNMEITVTDPALIEKTGGIVQGMSGSPIIQDGKLIGAVTHVLVSDPLRGYGIFIENMLDAVG